MIYDFGEGDEKTMRRGDNEMGARIDTNWPRIFMNEGGGPRMARIDTDGMRGEAMSGGVF